MARRVHGRKARLQVALDPAQPNVYTTVAFTRRWRIEFTTARTDVTAMGDDNIVELAGLSAARGTFDGFYDADSDQLYEAAADGEPRPFRIIPDFEGAATTYWQGAATFDFSVEAAVDGGVSVSGSFSATGPVTKNVPAP